MNTLLKAISTLIIAFPLMFLASNVQADIAEEKPFAEHKLVLQMSDADPGRQTLVLNVANNAIRYFGAEKIDVEIVAFGPGLSLLFADNPNADRITSLAQDAGIRFAACGNTVAAVTRMRGEPPVLHERAINVDAGVVRIMELDAAGYTILSP